MRVVLHDVPQDRTVAERHKRFRDLLGIIAQARTEPAAEQNDFHPCSLSGADVRVAGPRVYRWIPDQLTRFAARLFRRPIRLSQRKDELGREIERPEEARLDGRHPLEGFDLAVAGREVEVEVPGEVQRHPAEVDEHKSAPVSRAAVPARHSRAGLYCTMMRG